MTLSEADIDEFIAISERTHNIRLTREEAREAATRVGLLYERLMMPTPKEIAARLAKSSGGGKVSGVQVEPSTQINQSP